MTGAGYRALAELVADAVPEVVPIERARANRAARAPEWADDVLRAIDPPDYVRALTGVAMPPSGVIHCPLPGHPDRTPSFRAYPDPAGGWFCFGCARGGDIYTLGAILWDHPLPLRGQGFIEVKRQLLDKLLAVSDGAA